MNGLLPLLAMLLPVTAGHVLGRFAVGPRLPSGGPRRIIAVATGLIGAMLLWGGVGTFQTGPVWAGSAALAFGGVALGVASAAFRSPAAG
ncbi:MAG: hypothetical protein WD336_02435 [Trueperaceae bacterium]